MMANGRVLIIEDEREMSRLLSTLLAADGYETETAPNSATAIAAVVEREPDLVLLDVMLGDEDGRELFQELRCISEVPVVFLTGRGHEIDRIAGLKMGADDYVVKPFSPGELTARVESVLRRTRGRGGQPRDHHTIAVGQLHVDRTTREVNMAGRKVELTAKEFDLLAFLAASPRQVFSRAQLLDHVWNSSADWQAEATVTEHIRRLRQKIEADPDHPRCITTVRGVGYRFEPGGSAAHPVSP
jgi:DNA-binding response OmpR family regulator